MSIELMLNAVNLSFVTFAHQWHAGQRPDLRLLRHGGRRRRSRRRPRHHHCRLPRPRTPWPSTDRPDETMNAMPAPSLADSAAALRRLPDQRDPRPHAAQALWSRRSRLLAPLGSFVVVASCSHGYLARMPALPALALRRDLPASPGSTSAGLHVDFSLRPRPALARHAPRRHRRRLPHPHLLRRLHGTTKRATRASSPTSTSSCSS